MACGTTHRVVTAVVIGIAFAYRDSQTGQTTAWPVLGAGLGALLGTLPDLVEPADHPHHRQFFHSVVFAGMLGYVAYKLYEWAPSDPWKKVGRLVGLTAISAYLIHLAMDAQTPRSVPLIGKLG